MARTLTLSAERLAELTDGQLAQVAAAAPEAPTLGAICTLTRDVACMTMTSGC